MYYIISGYTYSIKESLKTWGCYFDFDRRVWKTTWIEKDETSYKSLKKFVKSLSLIHI